MRQTRTKKVTTVTCDRCGRKDGDRSGYDSGRMGTPGTDSVVCVRKPSFWHKNSPPAGGHVSTSVKPKCGHDICGDCWYYPGDLGHCPVCGPNRDGTVGRKK
jgi:hypothetical protein